MIDVQQVRDLAEVMTDHGLTEIRVREGDTSLVLRKVPASVVTAWPGAMMHAPGAMHAPAMPSPMAGAASVNSDQPAAVDEGLVPIVSPMVGTFYASPDPESPPFVTVGMELEIGTPVCIIEAMKVFNEIKAELAGRVERIMVKNEQAVEYGQPLILVRPRG